ncbi:ABC transporter ATP-binding protein [Corynebacterium mastitidis]|uniref:Macrolide ABC transporter ATP-binding protein n=1 Tax=Corynebacterium mastitidis TaxID=161890 RepID=A0A2N0X9U9_9CORY|nr:ABC transporter ATP-binding protein [Corynebacterium mastitidis]MCH6197721.1 ABC transporter ATP-binding protein [Corynebacterium mastitidis]PKF69484.1 macrolide ABC transporter ATP-binding protein [Corynebacterium mastitidis]
MNPAALTLENVTRLHMDGPTTVTALDSVSLTLEPGELVAITGRSGSGKSTLLNVAGTLDTPSSGRVLIQGVDTSELSATATARLRRTHVGYVFQELNLIPTLTAAENIAMPLELDGAPRLRAREQALEALDELGLTSLADRFPSEISGGQAQRIAIARALIGQRGLLLADEPTGALDTATGEAVMGIIRRRVDAGAGCLLVTHEPRFAAWADRTIYLRDGAIVGEE